jgi:hypothetical protein
MSRESHLYQVLAGTYIAQVSAQLLQMPQAQHRIGKLLGLSVHPGMTLGAKGITQLYLERTSAVPSPPWTLSYDFDALDRDKKSTVWSGSVLHLRQSGSGIACDALLGAACDRRIDIAIGRASGPDDITRDTRRDRACGVGSLPWFVTRPSR